MSLSLSVIAADNPNPNIVEFDRARERQAYADQLFGQSRFQDSIGPYIDALDIFQHNAFPLEAAVIRHQIGFAYLAMGDHTNALIHFEANLYYHRNRGDPASVANYLQYSAQIYADRGEYSTAKKYLDEARNLVRNQPARLADIEHWRIIVAERSNDLASAREIVETARTYLGVAEWSPLLQADALRLGLDPAARNTLTSDRKAFYFLLVFAVCVIVVACVKITGRTDWLVNATLTLVSITLVVLVVEGILRVLFPLTVGVTHFLHIPNRDTRFTPDRNLMPGVNYDETHFTINEAGVRGDPLPTDSRPRILVIGGSSTEGLFLDNHDAWPYQLQLQMNAQRNQPVWVGNAGKSGLNSFSHFVQVYFHRTELRPQLMLIQAGINDLNQCVSGGLNAIRDNHRLVRNNDFPLVYRKYVFDQIKPPDARGGSRLWPMLTSAFQRKNAQDKANGMEFVIQDHAGNFYTEQRARRQQAVKIDTLPDVAECLGAFEYNVRRMVEMAREQNVGLVLLTQGSLYRTDLSPVEENLLWFGSVDTNFFGTESNKEYYSARVMGILLDRYNAIILALCNEYALMCVDIATQVDRRVDNYYDDVHLTIAGAARVAAVTAPTTAAWLQQNGY